jgi:membrane associated rhomboid family serine protease
VIPLGVSVPVRRWPLVTWALVGINVWVFLHELALGPELEGFIRKWGFVPAHYFYLAEIAPDAWAERTLPILTSMFVHGGWMHLVGNMVYLWMFGDKVEDRLGHLRYLVLYVLGGVGAALAHAYTNTDSVAPTVGASGAISAVLGCFLVLLPHARVLTLIPLVFIFFHIVELPAMLYLGFWLLMQVLSGALSLALVGDAGGVAWWAHVGGFVVGMLVAAAFRPWRARPRAWRDRYVLR